MNLSRAALLALAQFVLRFRQTALGPLWLIIGPSLFIAVLGHLYASIGDAATHIFIPHLAIGLILWTLVNGFITGSATVFQRNRVQMIQGGQSLGEIVGIDVMTTVLTFLHQVPIIVVVFLIYKVSLGPAALLSFVGLVLVIANGIWATRVFGILGARFRDLAEVFQAVMRIAFLATPVIWMQGKGMQGGVMEKFLVFNPFAHFLQVVRAPLLGEAIEPLSWIVVISITLLGFAAAFVVTRRYARYVPLWV